MKVLSVIGIINVHLPIKVHLFVGTPFLLLFLEYSKPLHLGHLQNQALTFTQC